MRLKRSTWTDARLDDFKASVDARFDKLEARVDGLSARIDALQHTTIQLFIGIMVAMVTGFVTLAGLIVTQL
jgi:tetrahydromethanopterin S-methyltransferase subunit G